MRLSIRQYTYQGREGWSVSGRDPKGRRVRIFVRGPRSSAELVKANVVAGRDCFEGVWPNET